MTSEEKYGDLLSRLERVERSGRQWRIFFMSFFGVLVVLFVAGWRSGYIEKYDGVFYISDPQLNYKGALTTNPDTDQGKLMLSGLEKKNADGTYTFDLRRMVSIVGGRGGEDWGMTVYDDYGRARIFFGVAPAENEGKEILLPVLAFLDENGETVAHFGAHGSFTKEHTKVE